jgi:hypothetical protein
LTSAGSIPPIRLEALVHSATVDAVNELCRVGPTIEAARFRSRQRHWLGEVRPLQVAAVVAEAARRSAILQQIRGKVTPDSVLARAARLPLRRMGLSAAQWELIRATDGASAVTCLAWVLGRGVFSTTLEAYALIRLGVLETTDTALRAIGPDPTATGDPRAQEALPASSGHRRPELSFVHGHRGPSRTLIAGGTDAAPNPHRTLLVAADAHAAPPASFGGDDNRALRTEEFRP